ncbi:MAG: hypothetical protein O9353_12905, partial [Bacteroidia bacterium]|nr:hypothetical protein [Bacteroidia bacterium]
SGESLNVTTGRAERRTQRVLRIRKENIEHAGWRLFKKDPVSSGAAEKGSSHFSMIRTKKINHTLFLKHQYFYFLNHIHHIHLRFIN